MQEIINGINTLSVIMDKLAAKNILMVADSSYPFLCIKDVIDSLNVNKVVFSGFTPNPLFEQVTKGVKTFEENRCDAILAIGGGSAIDVAKCIKLALHSSVGVECLIPPMKSEDVTIGENPIPFIAIPTTAGTGSESTPNAVIYYNGIKQTITNKGILPDIAILEPSILKTLPLYQKKATMMDALCQSIESWWSVNSTEESQIYSKRAIELITANWEDYIFNNSDKACGDILLAANYSGRAIAISQTTAAHAMSYKITSLYGLSHGHAVALCLPKIWRFMINNLDKCIDARGEKYLSEIFDKIALSIGVKTALDAVTYIETMMNEMNLGCFEMTDQETELEELSKSVNATRLKNNPVRLDIGTIRELYLQIANKK